MATGKEFIRFILDQLSGLEEITCRSMMGEYIIYYRGKIAAYVCDNRLLVKPVEAAKEYILSCGERSGEEPDCKELSDRDSFDETPGCGELFNEALDHGEEGARRPELVYEPPYEGAKEMLLVEELDSPQYLVGLFDAMYEELPFPKPRKKAKKKESGDGV